MRSRRSCPACLCQGQFDRTLRLTEVGKRSQVFEAFGSLIQVGRVVRKPLFFFDEMPEMTIGIGEGANEIGITPRPLSY